MPALKEIQISLPADLAARLRNKMETGEYSSESDVIAESLAALDEREAEIESWLVNEVEPAYDRWMADPSRAVPIDEAFARLQARIDSSKDRQ
jgi:antitoxin ParD1/3/4